MKVKDILKAIKKIDKINDCRQKENSLLGELKAILETAGEGAEQGQ